MPSANCFWEAQYKNSGNVWAGAVDLPSLPRGIRVLEAGCGNGKTLLSMRFKGWNVTAFDFSPTAAALAKKAASPDMNVDIFTGDVSALALKDGIFDAVFARHVIGHLYEDGRKKAACELARVLKPSGRLYFVEFGVGDMKAEGEEREKNSFVKKTGIMTHFFEESETESLFSSAGLSKVSVETRRWDLKIRGVPHPRAEITGIFVKE